MAGECPIQGKRRVVRTYYDLDAPTGEGKIYVDEYNDRWREVLYFDMPQGTGERRARLVNGVINEI